MAARKVLPSSLRELHKLSRREIYALFQKLAECSTHGLSPLSRQELEDDYHSQFDKAACQDCLATKDGREFVHEYLDPSLLVQLVLTNSPRLARRWVNALMEKPATVDNPWTCIVGFDEYQPGDKFSYEKAKAVMCVYFNMEELDCVSQGTTWFCPVTVRNVQIEKVMGGWSHVFACFLHRMFLGEQGMQTAGITFSYEHRDYIVFAKLGHLLSDGDGHRKATGWKGASSLMPSLLHGNILKKDSDLATRSAHGFVEISCTNRALVIPTTKHSFEDSAAIVEEAAIQYRNGQIRKGRYEMIQKTESLNYVPGGLAYDMRLRNKVEWFEALTFDWVHTMLQDGVMSVEMTLRIEASKTPKIADKLKAFLYKSWNFPKAWDAKGQSLWRIFSERRLDENENVDKIRATASELLGVYSMVRHFFYKEAEDPSPENQNKFESFESCCRLLDYLLATKKELVPMDADRLLDHIEEFMTKHVSVYGSKCLKPKHCWLWGVAERWRRSKFVWDCFVIERLHLRVKAIGTRLHALQRFERTLLSGMLNEQLCALETLEGHSCLLGSVFKVDSLPDSCFASEMVVRNMILSVDDVVFRHDNAALLRAVAFEDGELYGVVEMWAHIAHVTPHASRWQSQTGDIRICPANELDQAAGLTNTRRHTYY